MPDAAVVAGVMLGLPVCWRGRCDVVSVAAASVPARALLDLPDRRRSGPFATRPTKRLWVCTSSDLSSGGDTASGPLVREGAVRDGSLLPVVSLWRRPYERSQIKTALVGRRLGL